MKAQLTLFNTEFGTIHDGLPNVLLFKILKAGRGGRQAWEMCVRSVRAGPRPKGRYDVIGPHVHAGFAIINFLKYDGAAWPGNTVTGRRRSETIKC
jgi:hypothetical protein